MALVTRCPNCGTHFKVVRDQLRISEGWVRCGRCSEVFDASTALTESDPLTATGAQEGQAEAPAREPAVASQAPEHAGAEFDWDDGPDSTRAALGPEAQDRPDALLPSAIDPSVDEVPDGRENSSLDDDLFDTAGAPLAEERPSQADTTQANAMESWPSADLLELKRFDQELAGVEAPETVAGSEAQEPVVAPSDSLTSDVPAPAPDAAATTREASGAESPPDPLPVLALPPLPPYAVVADEPWPMQRVPASVPALAADAVPAIVLSAEAGAPTSAWEATQPLQAAVHDDVQLRKALRRARAKTFKGTKRRGGGPAPAPEDPGAVPAPQISWVVESVAGAAAASRGWRRTPVLAALAVAAALLLALQVLRHERDALVARHESLRPWLQGLCAATGCALSPLRQIADISIEGSSFARAEGRANGYRLSFTLRSSAPVALAMPSVELTLLDMQERVLVRRVLGAADLGGEPLLASRADRPIALGMSLEGPDAASLPPVAGYRLVAFYP